MSPGSMVARARRRPEPKTPSSRVASQSAPSSGAERMTTSYYLADGTISSVLETVPYVNLTPEALTESRAAWDASK